MAKKKVDIQAIATATRDNPYWINRVVCIFDGLVYDVVMQSYFPNADPLTFRQAGHLRDFVYADKTNVYRFVSHIPENMDVEQFSYQPFEFQKQYQGYEIVPGIDGGSLKKIGGVDSDLFQDKNGYYWNEKRLIPATDLNKVQAYLQLCSKKVI